MGKKLIIVSYSSNTANIYAEQIKSLFSGNIDVEKYNIENIVTEKIYADLILVTSYAAYEKIKDFIEAGSQVIFVNRTLSKAGFEVLTDIPEGTEIVILDESQDMAKQIAATIYQLGIRHINLIPASKENRNELKNQTVVILGETGYLPGGAHRIINIGSSLLDISTILDIGARLNLDHVLNRQNIRESYKEIVTSNIGLIEVLGKTNRFESSLDILLQVVDDGVIAVNYSGQIFSYNQKAAAIMGIEMNNAIGMNGKELFPQIPFDSVIISSHSVKDKLDNINGQAIVISVDPIIHSNKKHGAVAVLKRFSEEEKKQHRIRAQLIGKGYKAKYTFDDIIGNSDVIIKCKNTAKRMASSNSSILLTGESGVGKEVFAQAIHKSSARSDYQFIAVNCGALPESLLESELFGYEEGAFTGARRGGKPGLFELAHKGTLFLDEIGEMPLNLQKRLLRVLQEREVMRLGGDRVIYVDIRVIAATNKSLEEMVSNGTFREDLYYRLNVLPLIIPPLRDRKEDILLHVEKCQKDLNCNFKLESKVIDAFYSHNWRGNIRELRNFVEYMANISKDEILLDDLPFRFNCASEDCLTKEDTVVASLIKDAGNSLDKYIFVLEELNKACANNIRLGRRSLYKLSQDRNILLGEQEIRRIILCLEKHSMVKILNGRGGTIITGNGIRAFKILLTVYSKAIVKY